MIINKIIKYDFDSKEADILIEAGDKTLIVYCAYLKQNRLGSCFELNAFLSDNIRKTDKTYMIEKDNDGFYSHKLNGKIICLNDNISTIDIDGIEIHVEDVPKDLKVGDFISFNTTRIDYFEL